GGGNKPHPLRVSARAELVQRTVERLATEHRGSRILELAESGVEAGGKRMSKKQTCTETVNRRDPCTVQLTGEVRSAALAQGGPDPGAQLARCLTRIGDHEDRLDVDASLANGPDVALDEDRRLTRAGARGNEDRTVGLDGGELLPVEPSLRLHDRHARGTGQIGHRSHHGGQPSPLGSCCTSPDWMRRALSPARSRAASIWLQNASSSR